MAVVSIAQTAARGQQRVRLLQRAVQIADGRVVGIDELLRRW